MNSLNFSPVRSSVTCFNPQLIVNPNLPFLLHKFGVYYLRNHLFRYWINEHSVYSFIPIRFSPKRLRISVDDLPGCYVLDTETGETYPIYLLVPCGHCELCTDAKLFSWVRRCQYESQLYNCYPVHMTLTYDEHHLPLDKSVSVDVHQKFMKRFRTDLVRAGYKSRIRFACSAEYGHKKHRPHYHYILWNLCANKDFSWSQLHDIALKAWQGQCSGFRLTMSQISPDYVPKGSSKSLRDMGCDVMHAFSYVAKYFYKPSFLVPGRKPTFHASSRGKFGGIGAPFIRRHSSHIRSLMLKEYFFCDRFEGKLYSMPYDRYLLDRVFPSKSISIPYRLRKAVRTLAKYVCASDVAHQRRADAIFDIYREFFYIPVVRQTDSGLRGYFCYLGRRTCRLFSSLLPVVIKDAFKTIDRYSDRDFSNVLDLDRKRQVILYKLFGHREPQDLSLKLVRSRRKRKDLDRYASL